MHTAVHAPKTYLNKVRVRARARVRVRDRVRDSAEDVRAQAVELVVPLEGQLEGDTQRLARDGDSRGKGRRSGRVGEPEP